MITTVKVRAAGQRAVKKKKIPEDSKLKTIIFCILTEQFDMDMAVAEEYIEYYTDKYNKLIKKHKYAMPLCKHIDKSELNNVIETSNIPAGYYVTAECIKDVEKFVQEMYKKFGNKDGSFSMNEVVIEISLHDVEHFLTTIYRTYFFIEDYSLY